MQEVLFVCPSAFLALNDKKNSDYKKALEFVRGLFAKTQKITTSFSGVAEAASLINQKVDQQKAEEFLSHFRKNGIDLLEEKETIQIEAEDIFRCRNSKIKGLTLFECLYVAIMHYFGIHKIFSFNKNFDKLEVIRVPKRKKEHEE